MFSRTERTYLQVLVDRSPGTTETSLEARFPNPVYRRKLMWGIRQKAARSLGDWQLYAEAARRDPRILPRESTGAPTAPLFVDPMVTILGDLRRLWPHRKTKDGASAVPEVTGFR